MTERQGIISGNRYEMARCLPHPIHSASDGLFRGIKAGVMHFVMKLLLRNEQKLKSSHLLSVTMSDIDLSRVRGSSRTHGVALEALGNPVEQ